jgi:hypothetical protein
MAFQALSERLIELSRQIKAMAAEIDIAKIMLEQSE